MLAAGNGTEFSMRPSLGGSFALVSQLGLTLALSIVFGLVLGLWVDAHFGTKPWAAVVFSLLGISAGIYGVIRLVSASIDQATVERGRNATDTTVKQDDSRER
jgi:F0F1-type ATP synthase assembly protein I